MNAGPALILLVLSVLLVAWGGIALVRRSRGTREPRPERAPINWQSPIWNVIGVLAGVLGAIAGIISLFK